MSCIGYFEEDVCEALLWHDKNKKMDSDLQAAGAVKNPDDACDEDVMEKPLFNFCSDGMCVWLSDLKNVVALDQMKHTATSAIKSTHHRVTFRHMVFHIIRVRQELGNNTWGLCREGHAGSLPR